MSVAVPSGYALSPRAKTVPGVALTRAAVALSSGKSQVAMSPAPTSTGVVGVPGVVGPVVVVGVEVGGVVGVWPLPPAGRSAVIHPASARAELTRQVSSPVAPASCCDRWACSDALPRLMSHASVHPAGGVVVNRPPAAPRPPMSMVPPRVVVTPGTASFFAESLFATDTDVSTGGPRSTPV